MRFIPRDIDDCVGTSMEMFYQIVRERLISTNRKQPAHSANDATSSLQRKALSHLSSLIGSIVDSRTYDGRDEPPTILEQLSDLALGAMVNIDEAHQFGSDENVLAMFKHTSSQSLKHVPNIFGKIGLSSERRVHLRVSPLEADYRLALLGFSQGLAFATIYDDHESRKSFTSWIRKLEASLTEHSVSLSRAWNFPL